ncbi:MAG TPA: phospholipase A [Verrucomicrobiae bacterium]|nr:phospholipase A [Verrucomicrobiae bacterium]
MAIFFSGRRSLFFTMLFVISMSMTASGKDLTFTFSESEMDETAAREGGFWINALNADSRNATWVPPSEIQCQLVSSQKVAHVTALLRNSAVEPITIAPGSFARREYTFRIPQNWSGEVMLEAQEFGAVRLVFNVPSVSPNTSIASAAPEKRGMVYFLKGRRHSAEAGQYDPDTFFKQHIFGYDPFYFIAGTESPNAKFQISFKYRLLNDRGWLAQKAPWMLGLHLAYSQTSLWDWNADSAPFFDSSYRPELLYSWDRVLGGGPTNWFRLDLQGGLQHESNGKSGSDSRSMNMVYFRPRLTFGKDSGPQLTLTPRAWVYVGDLSDNSDIEDYRGFADLRAAFGWKRGLQISALGRIGQRLSQGSVTIDATYPLMQPPDGSFSLYLHAQYFTGYGESLLGYRDRTDIFRVGIALYR